MIPAARCGRIVRWFRPKAMIKRSGCLIGTAAAGMWLRLVLINAASPWIDEVNEACDLPHNYGISKVG